MIWRLSDEIRSVLAAPLTITRAPETLGRALWLYLSLVLAANDRGIAIQSRTRLAESLAVRETEIDRWLARLLDAKIIDLQSPSPYLVISLKFWPGRSRSSALEALGRSGEAAALYREVPVSSDVAAAATSLERKQLRDGGPGEGATLRAEARAILGEASASEVSELLGRYPTPLIRKALRRVQITPAAQIRKSRAALFRFLLVKFADDLYGNSSPHHPHP